VAIHEEVANAFHAAPQSHRGAAFEEELRALRAGLCALANASHVEILLGSGTLANDAVAAQLSRLGGRGLVVSNGEFGERLVDHASRARLDFDQLRFDWGEPIDLAAIESANRDWLWMVACETSTGVLNDVAAIAEICRARGTKLCLDAVSALGAVPLDLSEVWLASCASGKALASYPGLSMVFHREPVAPSDSLPRYLDLGLYARDGAPFTQSSNLVRALRVAIERVAWPKRYRQIVTSGAWLRGRLRAAGFTLVGDRATPAPHVATIELPPHVRSDDVACALERAGFLVSWASGYLRARNWIQVCLMGEIARDALPALLRELTRHAPVTP
ncbi:MAG TPA: aminotransferase class V-fold PLP-dependent enzyme, partial [Thermoanaerobaculia bacterium]|nr:aminotransferase class V-fold PLP-dependent enzyme [Thermoanaerobaculia bacterium]